MKSFKNDGFSVKEILRIALRYGCVVDVSVCYPGKAYLDVHSPCFSWPYCGHLYSVPRSRNYIDNMLDDLYKNRMHGV